MEKRKEKSKSLAKASAEFNRITEMIEVLSDGETYLWSELERFFDVDMDQRGRAIFRRAVHAAGRLYSPMAHPNRGLGVVMGDGTTVADIVEHKQGKVHRATQRVIETIDKAVQYTNVPKPDMSYMRQLRSQNQALINRLKPPKRSKPKALISDGTDIRIEALFGARRGSAW